MSSIPHINVAGDLDDDLPKSGIDDSTARRQMLRTIGGTLAGVAAGLALCPRGALADARPTLTTLDERVTALEAQMTSVLSRLSALELAVNNSATPYMWSGGPSVTQFSGTGPLPMPLDVTEFNTAGDFLHVTPQGDILVLETGYYRFNFTAFQQNPVANAYRQVFLNVNGFPVSASQLLNKGSGTDAGTIGLDVTVRIAAGGAAQVVVFAGNGGTSAQFIGTFTRLQITRIGL